MGSEMCIRDSDERNNQILSYAQNNHISYKFIPGNSQLFFGNIELDLYENIPTISVTQTALVGWGRTAKRLFDISVGSILVLLTAPIMLLVWIALSVFGGGAAVYKQTRLSRFNTKIGLYKFRSHKREFSGLTPEQAFEKIGKPHLIKEYRSGGDQIDNDPRLSLIHI